LTSGSEAWTICKGDKKITAAETKFIKSEDCTYFNCRSISDIVKELDTHPTVEFMQREITEKPIFFECPAQESHSIFCYQAQR
jgi:hypothetical protein